MLIITKSCPKQSTCLCTTCWSVLAGGLIVDWLGSAFLNGDWWIIQIPRCGAPLSSSKIWRYSYISVKCSFGPRMKPSIGLLAVEIQSQILDSPFTQNVLCTSSCGFCTLRYVLLSGRGGQHLHLCGLVWSCHNRARIYVRYETLMNPLAVGVELCCVFMLQGK